MVKVVLWCLMGSGNFSKCESFDEYHPLLQECSENLTTEDEDQMGCDSRSQGGLSEDQGGCDSQSQGGLRSTLEGCNWRPPPDTDTTSNRNLSLL